MSALLSELTEPSASRTRGSAPRVRVRCGATGRRPAAQPSMRPSMRPSARPTATARRGVRAAGRPARPTLHLTRRGRLVVVLLLLAFVSVAFGAGRVSSTAVGSPSAPGAQVVVHSGDTLWSIAGAIAPQRDPRTVAGELMDANGLATPALQVGQHLRLP